MFGIMFVVVYIECYYELENNEKCVKELIDMGCYI